MRSGKDKLRPRASRRPGAYRPDGEVLEQRLVLTAFDLANIAGPPPLGPYGVELIGSTPRGGAGFSVMNVGDVNGDGFDDFVVGAPTARVTNIAGSTAYTLGNGSGSSATLVFGSQNVNGTTIATQFQNLTPQQRIGNLNNVGNIQQQPNPLNPNGGPGFLFNGLTLATSSTASLIGASEAALGDVNGDGFADFIIGAPGSNDVNGANPGTGRAYVVFGGPNLSALTTKAINLDSPLAGTVNVVSFTNVAPNAVNTSIASLSGYAVSQAGSFFGAGTSGIAIGAPNASVNGLTNNGAVYVIPSTFLASLVPPGSVGVTPPPLNLALIGQPNGLPGVVLTGATSGAEAGFSLEPAGNVSGVSGGLNQGVGDFLIGAPGFNPFLTPTNPTITGAGAAYLIYGSPQLANQATTANGLRSIILNRVGAVNGVSGATFTGTNTGDLTGFSVSSAGDFNNDGRADILIGSPGFSPSAGLNGAGRVSLIEGNAASSTTGPITGTIPLSAVPPTISSVNFNGAAAGDLTGFSVSSTLPIPGSGLNNILIGAPGYNNSAGEVYLIPGNPTISGEQSLSNALSPRISANVYTDSQFGAGAFLGSSVNGRLQTTARNLTVDGDSIGDFLIGASGVTFPATVGNGGVAFLVEGRFTPLVAPIASGIVLPIGVDAPAGAATYTINATTPADVAIHVDSVAASGGTPAFRPATDINPATVVVDGVAFPNATIVAIPDENGDGIPDAIITINPRSALNLPTGQSTFTLQGLTLANASQPLRRFVGTTTVIVSGGTNPGGGGGLPVVTNVTNTFGFAVTNVGVSNIGERLVPQVQTLSPLYYKPLSYPRAFRQFLPTAAYQARHQQIYNHDLEGRHFGNNGHQNHRTVAVSHAVFTRGQFRRDRPIPPIHHKVTLTIPRTLK